MKYFETTFDNKYPIFDFTFRCIKLPYLIFIKTKLPGFLMLGLLSPADSDSPFITINEFEIRRHTCTWQGSDKFRYIYIALIHFNG